MRPRIRTMCRLLLVLLLGSIHVAASANDWKLHRSQGPTRVEYRHEPDGLLQARAETVVESSLGAFLHLLEDTPRIADWAANTYRAELIATPAPRTHVVHTWFSAVWPVSKRDMVTRSTWQQRANGELTMQVSDVGHAFPVEKDHVRMQKVQAEWVLTPQAGGKLMIRYEGQADPAGRLPRFIGDKVALKALFKTFEQLPEALQQHQRPHPGVIPRGDPASAEGALDRVGNTLRE